MAGENNQADNNADLPLESIDAGEPGTGSGKDGESGKQASAKGEPGAEGLFDGMDAPTLHKSYKSLQSEYTKQNEQVKLLEKFGGAATVAQWAEYLSNNPNFAEWVRNQQSNGVLSGMGIDESQLDDDQKKAFRTVQKIAEGIANNIASAKVQGVMKEVGDLSEAYKQQLLDKHFDAMDKKYGSDWQEFRDTMSELSESLPEKIQDRPSFEDIEDLYWKAVRKSGKMESVAAKSYQKVLTDKKAKSTNRPGNAGDSAPVAAKTIAEAFEAAKRSHNL